jgi:Fic family protein
VARIVQSLVLAKEGLLRPELVSIEPYLGRHTREYYAVLEEVQGLAFDPNRDASPWVEFCIEAHVFEAREAALARDRERTPHLLRAAGA